MRLGIIDVFDDAASRERGLMNRAISEHECAVFVYDAKAMHSFWMKCVPIDLYLSAIDGGRCVWSERMRARSTEPHKVPVPVSVVIESRAEIPEGSNVDIIGDVLVVS